MELYKVLLVDDEEDVRRSIVQRMDWRALGFALVGEASNGQEALEKAEQLLPDVIMTDIKMPFMDGLTLCRRAKELLPGVRVAIFSGFDEFEYAREAIARQVEEYILKPIDAAELAAVFRRIRQALDAEIAQRRDVARLRRHYEQSLPLMRRQLLTEWLGGMAAPDVTAAVFAGYGLDTSAENYCVAVVRAPHGEDAQTGGDAHLLRISLQQLVNDTLHGGARFHLVQAAGDIALLFLLAGGSGVKQITPLLGQLFPMAKKLLGVQLSIGVGGAYPHARQVPLSREEALRALEYQILVEPGQCLVLADIEPGAETEPAADTPLVEELLRQIKVGRAEDVQSAAAALMQHFKSRDVGMQQYRIALLELSTALVKIIRTYRLDADAARLGELLGEGRAPRFSNLEELGRWLSGFCENLHGLVRRERKDSARLLVERAKEILAARYADCELSQDAVCGQLNVSPAYFSTLFKKETGRGFVGYLTALRMEKALQLLGTTDEKTYQVAERVGYADANYFSYVFKKQYGISPAKYRGQGVAAAAP